MDLRAKNLGISTGGILIAVMNEHDARRGNFHQGDRVCITPHTQKSHKHRTVAVLDITSNDILVPSGTIGMFVELSKDAHTRAGQHVTVEATGKPESIEYIRNKLHGKPFTKKEIETIISDVVNHRLTDIEKTYFVAACFHHELSDAEVVNLTNAMIGTGEVLKLRKKPVMDKHCIGGVAGNRTTAVVVPIVAAAGLQIPKTSSRSITSPAGTSDTMEVLCNVCLPIKQMKKVVKETGGCLVWGGAMNLAPADDKLIKIEHPISLDPVGQLLASILAKKRSVSATHVLIDIPLGRGAKIDDEQRALLLKHKFETIGRKLDMHVRVAITDGSEPIGNGIGPALEARDILWTLNDDPRGSKMLKEKAIELGGILLEMGKKAKKGEGALLARDLVESGAAYKKFIDIIEAQGAHITDAESICLGEFMYEIKAHKSGIIVHVDNERISQIAKLAGAPKDKVAGLYLYHHKGEHVQKGDTLYTIYSASKVKLRTSRKYANNNKGFLIE
ncbi:MAG: AMP phosphorylase [Nanoarchaeota archaeon]